MFTFSFVSLLAVHLLHGRSCFQLIAKIPAPGTVSRTWQSFCRHTRSAAGCSPSGLSVQLRSSEETGNGGYLYRPRGDGIRPGGGGGRRGCLRLSNPEISLHPLTPSVHFWSQSTKKICNVHAPLEVPGEYRSFHTRIPTTSTNILFYKMKRCDRNIVSVFRTVRRKQDARVSDRGGPVDGLTVAAEQYVQTADDNNNNKMETKVRELKRNQCKKGRNGVR